MDVGRLIGIDALENTDLRRQRGNQRHPNEKAAQRLGVTERCCCWLVNALKGFPFRAFFITEDFSLAAKSPQFLPERGLGCNHLSVSNTFG